MANHDAKVADHMKRHGIRLNSTRAEVIQAWDRVAHPMRGWIEWNIKRHRDEAARLRAQGFTLSDGDHGFWARKN